jgi:hypothetical protein
MNKNQHEERATGIISLIPSFHTNVLVKRRNNSLITKGWVGDEPCYITVNVGASVTSTDLTYCRPVREAAESAGWPIDSI